MKETELISIIKELGNYEEAAEALLQLRRLNPKSAEELAKEILRKKLGDIYFQSSAFNTVYSVNPNWAIDFAKNRLDQMEIYLIGTLVENLTEDSPIFRKDSRQFDFLQSLGNFLRSKPEHELKPIKNEVDWFFETYSSI